MSKNSLAGVWETRKQTSPSPTKRNARRSATPNFGVIQRMHIWLIKMYLYWFPIVWLMG